MLKSFVLRNLAVLLGALPALSLAADRETLILDTPRLSIRIEVRCPEGNVTCDDIAYRGENKRTKQVISLMGRSVHRMCADGVTPCRFLGYQFDNGRYRYFISDAGELVVSKGDKVLSTESGEWR